MRKSGWKERISAERHVAHSRWNDHHVSVERKLFGNLSRVHPNVLLEYECVGELLVANRTLVHHPHRWLSPMHAHVCLQVALGGECPAADLAPEGSLAGVRAVVHLEGALATQSSIADGALIWIGQFLIDVPDQLFHLARFGFLDFHELLHGVFGFPVHRWIAEVDRI